MDERRGRLLFPCHQDVREGSSYHLVFMHILFSFHLSWMRSIEIFSLLRQILSAHTRSLSLSLSLSHTHTHTHTQSRPLETVSLYTDVCIASLSVTSCRDCCRKVIQVIIYFGLQHADIFFSALNITLRNWAKRRAKQNCTVSSNFVPEFTDRWRPK